jgi:hypothetical protein
LKHHRETRLMDVVIDQRIDWISIIKAQLMPNKRKAPNYQVVMKILEEARVADVWALNTCRAPGADKYYNPIIGTSLFDVKIFRKAGNWY